MRNFFQVIFGMLLSATGAWAQSGLEVSASYFTGFQNHSLRIWDGNVADYSAQGYRGRLGYTYRFADSCLEGQFALGYRSYDFKGKFEGEPFTGVSTRVLGTIGLRYWWADRWATGLHWVTENNRDDEDLRSATSDNFRYNVELEMLYRIYKGLGATLHYSRIVYPKADHYLILNPSDQVMVGLNYHFF